MFPMSGICHRDLVQEIMCSGGLVDGQLLIDLFSSPVVGTTK